MLLGSMKTQSIFFRLSGARSKLSRALPTTLDQSLQRFFGTKLTVTTLEDMASEKCGAVLSGKSVGPVNIIILDIVCNRPKLTRLSRKEEVAKKTVMA